MKQFDAEILENRDLTGGWLEVFLAWPQGLRAPLPGQFVTVGSGSPVPLLRQPYPACYHPDSGSISLLYHINDKLGPLLARLSRGEALDLLGPRGFPFQAAPGGNEVRPLLVYAGAGLGALVFAANTLASKGYHPHLILAGSGGETVPRLDLHAAVRLTHSAAPGFLDTLAEERAESFVWAAGPKERLAGIQAWAAARKIPCQVRLEQITACAVGACQGCTVATTDERKVVRVCTEGPVFRSEVIQWT